MFVIVRYSFLEIELLNSLREGEGEKRFTRFDANKNPNLKK